MRLCVLFEDPDDVPPAKGGPVHSFGYENWHRDKRPRLLYFGKYRHPNGNLHIGGLNLNYIPPRELKIIQSKLPEIYEGGGSLKDHYDRANAAIPWAMQRRWYNSQTDKDYSYQTYLKKDIHSVTKDTLQFIDPAEIDDQADAADAKHPAFGSPKDRADSVASKAGAGAAKAAAASREKDAIEVPPQPQPPGTQPDEPPKPTEVPTPAEPDDLPTAPGAPEAPEGAPEAEKVPEGPEAEAPAPEAPGAPEGAPEAQAGKVDYDAMMSAMNALGGGQQPRAMTTPGASPFKPGRAMQQRQRARATKAHTTSGGTTIQARPTSRQRENMGFGTRFVDWLKKKVGGASSWLASKFKRD